METVWLQRLHVLFFFIGGFSGRTPHPTLSEFRRLVADGQLRYVIEPSAPAVVTSARPATTADSIAAWVGANCHPVRTGHDQTAAAGGDLFACEKAAAAAA